MATSRGGGAGMGVGRQWGTGTGCCRERGVGAAAAGWGWGATTPTPIFNSGANPLLHHPFQSASMPGADGAKTVSGGDLLEKPIALLPSTKLIKEGFEFKYKTLEHIYENMVEYGKALGILPN
ncbi:hypothetical protein SORBI_3006G227750 [Sorghum bicolor]|uniref:Uncharacterized protein n=1 Tax=Sorghum bicolor TaxID=4558 RepID=A0A1Z5RF68_SORBI|nr:hypothetical protein SORBI_3006G227750 [Sorghum bicolor]